jgi:hypothetical protein
MNIIELAQQAGFIVNKDSQKYQPQSIQSTHSLIDEPLKKFAELVAAHEREECAKVCELQDGAGLSHEHWWECAAAIRARSKK